MKMFVFSLPSAITLLQQQHEEIIGSNANGYPSILSNEVNLAEGLLGGKYQRSGVTYNEDNPGSITPAVSICLRVSL